MKRFIIAILAIISATLMYSQRVDVEETTAIYGKDMRPSLATKVLFTDAKTVTKEFSNLLKGYNPEALTTKKGLLFADNIIIPSLSENAIDIWAQIKQEKGSDVVELYVAFYIGSNIYVTSTQSPSQYQTAYNMLKIFANDLSQKKHDVMLKKAAKVLTKEKGRLESLERKQASYQENVDKSKSKIAELQKDIDKNEKKLGEVKDKIEKQRIIVNEKRDAFKRIENQ